MCAHTKLCMHIPMHKDVASMQNLQVVMMYIVCLWDWDSVILEITKNKIPLGSFFQTIQPQISDGFPPSMYDI